MSINPKVEQMEKAKVKKLLNDTYILECIFCEGTGAVENGIECFKAPSDCCGGCMTYAPCEVCNSSGELEALDDEMLDQFMMLRAIENIVDKFLHIKKTFRSVASEDMLSDYQLAEIDKQVKRYESLSDQITEDIKYRYDSKR